MVGVDIPPSPIGMTVAKQDAGRSQENDGEEKRLAVRKKKRGGALTFQLEGQKPRR